MTRPRWIAACVLVLVCGLSVAACRQETTPQNETPTLGLAGAVEGQTKQQALSEQVACAEWANTFIITRGQKPRRDSDYYENHFSASLNTCFVLDSTHSSDGFRTFDLYDAVKGKRYATYSGFDGCDAILGEERCALNQGFVWFDGDDQKEPDFEVKYATDGERTARMFLDRIRILMER